MMKHISTKVKKALGLIIFTGLSGVVGAQSAQSFTWSLAGPVYNAGRIRNIVIDKTDLTGNTIYAGSTSSGVFKTTDGGVNWAPLDDQGSVKNISYMSQSPDNSIYVATGEGFLRPGQIAKAQRGTGLYKLVNNSLQRLVDSTAVGAVITRIACNPINANQIALATNKGVYVSTNAGVSFGPVTLPGVTFTTNVYYGMDVKFDSQGTLWCSVGNERGVSPYVGTSFGVSAKVFKSTNLTSFVDKTPTSSALTSGTVAAVYGRIELAVAPSNNNVIYASCARKSGNNANNASLYAIFVSYDGGDTWGILLQGSSQLDPLSYIGLIASGDYAHTLMVHPTLPDVLFVGSYSFYVFSKTGGTQSNPIGIWVQLGNPQLINTPFYLHENIHDIRIGGSPSKFYFVTDAGIYRSVDLNNVTFASIATTTVAPSFQPFYKGLVTGQFNSVSMESYPASIGTETPTTGEAYNPAAGFIGGTGGNGLNYFSGYYDGTEPVVYKEINYLDGDVYNAEMSKILQGAAITTIGNGTMYRSSDVRTSAPTLLNYNTYSGALSRIAPASLPLTVGGVSTGSPFRLWENYGQYPNGPDKAVFYNDSARAQASIIGVSTLTTQTTFTFSAARPNPAALIDSIVIRTATVAIPVSAPYTSVQTAFTNRQDVFVKLADNYTTTNSITIPPITSSLGLISAVGVTLNANTTLGDNISVTFNSAPFAAYTQTAYLTGTNVIVPDPAAYYRVFATVFYRYKAGDSVSVSDDNISTLSYTYTTQLPTPLNWKYGNGSTSYTVSANSASVVSSPTYVLTYGSAIAGNTVTQSTPDFTVQPSSTTNYTVVSLGNYSISIAPVVYTLTASTDTSIPGPTYTYTLLPDNVTFTTASTSTVPVTFTVSPAVNTNYTITQSSSSSTATANTYSTVNTTTYVLNPGNVQQSSPVFTVSVTSPTPVTVYTLSSIPSMASVSSSTVTRSVPARVTASYGSPRTTYPANNAPVYIPTHLSARLAMAYNSSGATNGQDAVVVSKAPLNLNDPLNFVRLSQSGCLSTNPDGTPSNTLTQVVNGKATVLQWSNQGTELYYATDQNKLYRVSYINRIMDYAPASYSGKLNTDIFVYNNTTGAVGNQTVNPNSPYRTALLGSFNKRITSINITRDDSILLLTFDDTTSTSAQLVSRSSGSVSVKRANTSNINFVTIGTPSTGLTNTTTAHPVKVYCAMIIKDTVPATYRALIGTDVGVFYKSDFTNASASWVNANNGQLPNVQVFDIKQQTLNSGECYNPGEIYIATNGRGVWTNGNYQRTSYVGIKENALDKRADKNISIFPNPTNDKVSVLFNGIDGESAAINILDLSGRIIKTETLGKLNPGEVNYTLDVTSLNAGIYLLNVSSTSKEKRTAKLIIAK